MTDPASPAASRLDSMSDLPGRLADLVDVGWTRALAAIRDVASLMEDAGGFMPLALWGAGAVLLVVLLWRHWSRRPNDAAEGLASLTRGPKRLGLAAIAVFAAVFLGWAVFAPLASAALAPGVISPDGHRKTIQHLEGGIVRAIHVREGDPVSEGDPLITLDATAAKSLEAEIRTRYLHVLAMEARLEAERTGALEIDFPEVLLRGGSRELMQVMEGQRQLLLSRHATHRGRTEILESRVLQLMEQNAGLEDVMAAQEEQIALIDEEIVASQALLDQGLERKPKLLALRRARADLAGARAANAARIAENAQAIGETRLQLLAVVDERQEQIGAELTEMRRVLAELKGQLPSREDILARTVIRAPISGRVMNLTANTRGGVVRPGEPLLDIVPDDAQLVIDARVRPTDVDRVLPGMSARVILTAYKQRDMPLIHGRVRSISADVFADERTGLNYYLAKVEVLPEDLVEVPRVELIPGMPAEVMLVDGEQSLLAYMLAPIVDSARRSLREN